MSDFKVNIWTIQERTTWFTSQHRADFHFADVNHPETYLNYQTHPAYKWMFRQLHQRIDDYSGYAPIWAWTNRPNIREMMRGIWKLKSPNWILVCANVPIERTLPSCYNRWHVCLNNGSFSEEENDVEGTWGAVFDLHNENLVREYGKPQIQLCVDRIFDHEIISIHRIRGRKLLKETAS